MQNTKVDSKQLVQHFNKYLTYRNQVKNSGEFAQKVEQASSKEQHSSRQEFRKTGQRFRPPVVSNRPKNITATQANRLAKYAPIIQDMAAKHNVPVELICGVILQESGGKAKAVSHAGAKGLMQLMPATAKRFGVKDVFDPAQNIEGGTKYLRWLLDRFDGKMDLALAGYNAGEGNVEKYGNKIPPFKETQAYVPNVLGYTQSMINIFASASTSELPSHARRA
ncbi:MAG: lytic transglycosylase domain-containing protein [Pseudomonadota bacterium]